MLVLLYLVLYILSTVKLRQYGHWGGLKSVRINGVSS